MKSKPTKVRPPRVYRTKTGRPYIKYKGKKIYLNFGKKTNDMSTLNIIKLFLKYLTKKKRSTTTRRSKSVIEKPEQENREKVHMQIEKYLSDKYSRINEMDKIEEKKRKEAKERAEEKKRGDEAKARQELLDADERKRDIDRAIERERKLQAELKADRVVSQTVLRQLTASNDRIERLIEEGKNVARDVKEQAVVEAIPIEDAPRRGRRPRIAAPKRPKIARIAVAPTVERKMIDDGGDRKRVDNRGERKRVDNRGEEKGRVDDRGDDRKVRDGGVIVEDVTAIDEAQRAEREAKQAQQKAEEAKLKAERDAKVAIDNAEKSIRKAKERQQQATEDAKKAKEAKRIAEEDVEKAKEAKRIAEQAAAEAKRGVDKTVRGAAAAKAAAKNSMREAKDAKKQADESKREAEAAQNLAEESKREAVDAQNLAEESKKEAKDAKEAAEKAREESNRAKEETENAREEVEKAREEVEKLKAEAKRLERDNLIDRMFKKQIKDTDTTKKLPTELVSIMQMLGYDIKIVKQLGKKMNALETITNFLKANPDKFDLGYDVDGGWYKLITQLNAEMADEKGKKKAKAEEKERAKEKAKSRDDSKQEAEAEAEEEEEAEAKQEAEAEDPPEEDEDGSGDGNIEEVDEQEGKGLRILEDICVKIIDKLKVGDIKKFLKKTHTDAYRKKYRHKGKLLKFNYIESLILAMADEKIRSAVCSELAQRRGPLNPQARGFERGTPFRPLRGLTTAQLDGLMADEKRYLGTVASDEINTLKPNGTKYAFIMNTDKASKPGQHWIAVYVDLKGDKTVEVYDPLGTYEPTKEFLEQIKTLVDMANLEHYLLLKVNKIKNQSDTSDTCGWFAVKFLKERFMGNRFKFSTGFTQLKEDEIQKYKKQNGYGFDTYL